MPAIRQTVRLSALLLFLGSSFFFITYSQSQDSSSTDQIEFFEKKVRPLLAGNCAPCHNTKAKVAELDITTAGGFRRGGESGALIDRENPMESRLLKVIGYQEKLKMPPSGKLKDEEIEILASWVKIGAPWPETKLSPKTDATKQNGVRWSDRSTGRVFTEDEKNFWSFQPVARKAPPSVRRSHWVKSPIDALILQGLERKMLAPAPPADKLMLLRRATYDLTGLPPSGEEIIEFLTDKTPDAFRKVVERLLASPRYGEKWGRHWLDVGRYADSTGNDEDHRYQHAWKYRDYVIEAFNKDLPYDQFVREQVAGDLLPPAKDGDVNRRGIIATGLLALGPKAIAQQDKKKMLYDVYDEQLDVTTRAFLGLTVSCARCHNHKFDPILTKDYYSMLGIFASTRSFSDPMAFVSQSLNKPLVPKSEYGIYLEKKRAHEAEVKRSQLELDEIVDRARRKLVVENGSRLGEFMLATRDITNGQSDIKAVANNYNLAEDILKKWIDYLKPGKVRQHLLEWENAKPEGLSETARGYQQRFLERFAKWNEKLEDWRARYQQALAEKKELPDKPEFEAGQDRFFHEVYFGKEGPFSVLPSDQGEFTGDDWHRITQLKQDLEELKKQAPPEPEMACAVEEGDVVDQRVFIRGDYHNEGEEAPKDIPTILAGKTKPPSDFTGSGRLQLAEWLTQPGHPLTARVMVNRIWQWHFGEGIVRTPDNFGKMGERPTHPQLLDLLARKFIESGWSIKSMHRLIMLSSAYQMSSKVSARSLAADPENLLLSRFNRRRLTIEEMRDGLLAIDGSLDRTMGGSLQTGTGTDGENDNKRLSLNPEKLNRRTIYLPLRRANLPTLLNLFDFGDATTPSGKRQLTNVATQALFWMNSEFMTERSKKLAQLVLNRKDLSKEARVKLVYLRVVNREATVEEVRQSVNYISSFKQKYAQADLDAWQSLCRVLMSSNDFIYVD